MNGSFQLSFTKTIPKTEPNSVYVSLSYARTQLYFCLASFGFELDFLSLLVLNCPLGIDSCKLAMIFDKSTHLSWNEISNWTIFYIFSIFSVWFGVACPHATINTKFVIFWAKCMSQLQMEFLFDWLNSFFSSLCFVFTIGQLKEYESSNVKNWKERSSQILWWKIQIISLFTIDQCPFNCLQSFYSSHTPDGLKKNWEELRLFYKCMLYC